MAVTEQNTRNVSVAAAGATVFPFDFKILHESQLLVLVTRGLSTTAQQLNIDYTVSGAGLDTGGNITFSTPMLGGETVLRKRSMKFERLTDFQALGDLRSGTLNNDQDSPVMMIQQLANEAMREIFQNGEFVWDAKGNRIINLGDPKSDRDAVNLRSLYLVIEALQAGGSVAGAIPKYWQIHGNGEDTDFELPGADIDDLLFYDVVVSGLSKEPFDEYTIVKDSLSGTYALRLAVEPADGAEGFVILRGYAKPWTGGAPVTSLRIPIVSVAGTTFTADKNSEFSMLRTTSAAETTITIPPNGGSPLDFQDGSYFSVVQRGDGRAVLAPGPGVSIIVPPGFQAATRASGSVISAVCEYADGNVWVVGNDMALV